jgi:hypothetical protein
MSPPRPHTISDPVCGAHAAIAQGIDDLKESATNIQTTLTDLRIQLAGDLTGYEQSVKGAWKEIRDLRQDVRALRSGAPTGAAVGPRGDESTGNVDVSRAREEMDLGRGSTFRIPIPKAIVWIAISIGIAIAAGGWAWGMLQDARASAVEQQRAPRVAPVERALAPILLPPQQ